MLHRWSDVTFIYLSKSSRSELDILCLTVDLLSWRLYLSSFFLKQRLADLLPKDVKMEEAGATGTPGAALAL